MVIYTGGTKTLNKPFAYRAEFTGDNVTREGWAMPGTLTSVSKWQICEHSYTNGNLTATKWPQPDANSAGSGEFSFEWDERDNYTYS